MIHVHVKGGTGAGRRTIRPRPEAWECEGCDTLNAPHWARCPVCKTPRLR